MNEYKGTIEHIIFYNDENHFGIFTLEDADGDITTVTGTLPGMEEGMLVKITGTEVEHPMYGPQIKMTSYEELPLEDAASIRHYLASGAVKGVGEKMAARIVERFGTDTFRVIEEEPMRLVAIKGISERIARDIAIQVVEKKEMRGVMLFLDEYGIKDRTAAKLYERYGIRVYEIIRTNPYKLADEVDGIGFKRADEIAMQGGLRLDSEMRICSGMLYVLSQAALDGHTCLPKELCLQRGVDTLGLPQDVLEVGLDNLMMDGKIALKWGEDGTQYVYHAQMHYMEQACASKLYDLNVRFYKEGKDKMSEDEAWICDRIAEIEAEQEITLDEMQREAVQKAVTRGVFILTGGPGTGKTTTIHTILRFFERERMDIVLAAPTGRAAKRMTETCKMGAVTIHRLLEVTKGSEDGSVGRFKRCETNPLEADVIIVDEMSMVDLFLFYSLLMAIPQGAHLILVGDVDQLPSVGAGKVLADIIDSGIFSVTMLQKIFRQAMESRIVTNAHRIHAGESLELDNASSKDFFVMPRGNAELMYKHIVELATDRFARYVGVDPMEVQVLTPMRKGPMGVEQLNTILQRYINPESPDKPQIQYGDRLFRQGDKVMHIKNNYDLEWEVVGKFHLVTDRGHGVFNGDIGVIKTVYPAMKTIIVEYEEGREVRYGVELFDELELAYAITIHKSQGSEYPAVIIALLGVAPVMLYRNLLYTAVTRGKECVGIIGQTHLIDEMIAGEDKQKRYTGLKRQILEIQKRNEAMHGYS